MPSTDFGVPIDPNKPNEFVRKLDSLDNEENDDESSNSSISTRPNMDSSVSSNRLRCWQHISKLTKNAIAECNRAASGTIDESLPIVVCGFSKGCVVLNQMCHELVEVSKLTEQAAAESNNNNNCEETKSLGEFSARVKHLIWLDGGHSGSSNSWIVDERTIETIRRMHMACYVYVTPYQMKSTKTWAIDEYEKFVALLDKCHVSCRKIYYFQAREDDDFDVDLHFQILREFDTNLIV